VVMAVENVEGRSGHARSTSGRARNLGCVAYPL
jgi:hypothetical protein